MVEIHCEKIRDLLDPLGRDNLAIKQTVDGGTHVEGATEVCVTDEEQLVGVMEAGLAQRAVKGQHIRVEVCGGRSLITVCASPVMAAMSMHGCEMQGLTPACSWLACEWRKYIRLQKHPRQVHALLLTPCERWDIEPRFHALWQTPHRFLIRNHPCTHLAPALDSACVLRYLTHQPLP